MRYLVVYDISDNNLRSQTAELLKDYGLKRIQKSAFAGELRRHELKSLAVDLSKTVKADNLKVFPLCDTCFRGMISIGQEYVEEEGEKVAYF